MRFRVAQASDLKALAELCRKTVLRHAPQHYSRMQTQAWANTVTDPSQFRMFILEPTTYIAEDETGVVGFAGIATDGHVVSAYVRGDRLRQGVGSALMQVVLDHARMHHISHLYGEASEFSLGLFQKFGFQLSDTEVVERQGVAFTRYLVERWLPLDSATRT